ncbi:hypothetical protein GJ697_19055 [Pseudoduganella sp. FT25W]|uniref:Uncharacterized protein n=1 Tax=Duganella alba TaxID=2666081 RepID=A0A6L5QLW1_9BURK|nr:hypothetical protein [Duganella alba]MRX09941.1 hypothetical protein [Duganella alba]MRX17578.1 hypothetical protein [Duganella alba]
MNFLFQSALPTAPVARLSTYTAPPADWAMQFQVSLNEEHVFLTILRDGAVCVELGERVHHYSLLLLARRRLEDARRGLDRDSQGWIDIEQLTRMLGLDSNYFNLQMLRARRQVLQALPLDCGAPVVIERRRGEVRFGGFRIGIVRGASVEAQGAPAHGVVVIARNEA